MPRSLQGSSAPLHAVLHLYSPIVNCFSPVYPHQRVGYLSCRVHQNQNKYCLDVEGDSLVVPSSLGQDSRKRGALTPGLNDLRNVRKT